MEEREIDLAGMKLIVDMNLSPRWIPLLGRSQIEAVHWSSVG
jgi:predicted nuclease of predicted toxin-antitoxin system